MNIGQKSEIVMILNHLYCFSYGIVINEKLGKYNYEPVFLSEGNINEPQKKKRLDDVLFRTYIEGKYGKIDLKEFNKRHENPLFFFRGFLYNKNIGLCRVMQNFD
jgi:hypothetical protein